MTWTLDAFGDELVNLDRFDSVRINGQSNGEGSSTHWIEAARIIGPDPENSIDLAPEIVSTHLYFANGTGEEGNEDAYDALGRIQAALERGDNVIDLSEKVEVNDGE